MKGYEYMKRKKIIILCLFLLAILLIPIGYSSFTSSINLDGLTEITGTWDIKIVSVDVTEVSEGCDAGTPQFTDNSVTFAAKLQKPGDEVVYLITIKNAGNIDAILNNVFFISDDKESDDAIVYETDELANELGAGDETTLTVKVSFNKDITTNVTAQTKKITGFIEYTQK